MNGSDLAPSAARHDSGDPAAAPQGTGGRASSEGTEQSPLAGAGTSLDATGAARAEGRAAGPGATRPPTVDAGCPGAGKAQ